MMLEQLAELRRSQGLSTRAIRERLLASPDVSVVFNYPYEHGVDGRMLSLSHELELRDAYQKLLDAAS